MFSSLSNIFNDFIENIANGGQWTYIFIGLFINMVLLNGLLNMTRR